MSTELLLQILIIVSTIAVLSMTAVLWRMFGILSDINRVSMIAAKRADQLDAEIERTKQKIEGLVGVLQNFLLSFEFIRMIKRKLENAGAASKTDGGKGENE